MSVTQAAKSLIHDGKYDQGVLNMVEMSTAPTIRACLARPPAGRKNVRQAGYFSMRRASCSVRWLTERLQKGERMCAIGQATINQPEIKQCDLPDFCRKPIVVLGIGNLLFGDDGYVQLGIIWRGLP